MTRTVDNARLQARFRVVGRGHIPPRPVPTAPATSCDCHGTTPCPSLDHRARHAEGQLPIGFAPEPYGIETSGRGLATCIAIAAVIAIVLTVGWLAYFVFGWVIG